MGVYESALAEQHFPAEGWTEALPTKINEIPLQAERSQVEKKFDDHAAAFGVTDPRGRVGFQNFETALKQVMAQPSTQHIVGFYHDAPAILNYNPQSGLCVVQYRDGIFWTGFKLTEGQASNVVNRGRLGGGDW